MKYFIKGLFLLLGVFIVFTINYGFLTDLVLKDEFKYGNGSKKTGLLFSLFYTISSDTGYVPDVSMFNVLFSLFLGVVLGGVLNSFFEKNFRIRSKK